MHMPYTCRLYAAALTSAAAGMPPPRREWCPDRARTATKVLLSLVNLVLSKVLNLVGPSYGGVWL